MLYSDCSKSVLINNIMSIIIKIKALPKMESYNDIPNFPEFKKSKEKMVLFSSLINVTEDSQTWSTLTCNIKKINNEYCCHYLKMIIHTQKEMEWKGKEGKERKGLSFPFPITFMAWPFTNNFFKIKK